MSYNLEEEIVRMLSPKIKSVLRQTHRQNQEDLEQELLLMIITKVKNKKYFSKAPSFFQLVDETVLPDMLNEHLK